MRRKFLAAREDLVDKLSKIAQEKNVTLFGMVNEVLEEFIRSEENGQSLREVVDSQLILKMAKEAGLILVTENFWNYILDKGFENDKEVLDEMWRSTGQWFGRCCKIRLPSESPLGTLERAMRALPWNISEVNITRSKDGGNVTCIGSRLSLPNTTLLAAFMIGFMDSFGYTLSSRNISRGIISLDFKRGE
ncbi:MAG: hypothetical protein QXJ75_00600 [Candidatus Bathyarchaeia archaeon]